MPIYDRQQRQQLDQLVQDFADYKANRRQFLQRALAVGLSASAATSLLIACGGGNGGVNSSSTPTKVSSIDALTVWSGEELNSFNAINTAFTKKTGIKVNVEATRDLPTVLNTRLRGNNLPDITGSPDLTTFHKLASTGKLLRLDKFFNMSDIQQNYAPAWINLASDNGGLYAVLPKANTKGTIWYSPKQFQANGYTVPTDWSG